MHMHRKYGYTVLEIHKSGFDNIFQYINYTTEASMDLTLAKTIEGLSSYIQENKPDLLVIHGDRVEALAGAITGSMNNILVAHIEGGEVSGTIDELIRHSVSKMSHVHYVSNELAKKRLVQMGEMEVNIHVIGSPDIDLMFSDRLPSFSEALAYYQIPFEKFGVLMFHPVTTEEDKMAAASRELVDAAIESNQNFLVIYPNNDLGSRHILEAYERLKGNPRFSVFPSLRFEFFLALLKKSLFILGNSSAGIREAPYYGIPAINIGSRQQNRALHSEIINVGYNKAEIVEALQRVSEMDRHEPLHLFGSGNSDQLFLETLLKPDFWATSKQKVFKDLDLS
jgi:UDP-N-acetylglucosamine 2-epimerase (hydrolysing)